MRHLSQVCPFPFITFQGECCLPGSDPVCIRCAYIPISNSSWVSPYPLALSSNFILKRPFRPCSIHPEWTLVLSGSLSIALSRDFILKYPCHPFHSSRMGTHPEWVLFLVTISKWGAHTEPFLIILVTVYPLNCIARPELVLGHPCVFLTRRVSLWRNKLYNKQKHFRHRSVTLMWHLLA